MEPIESKILKSGRSHPMLTAAFMRRDRRITETLAEKEGLNGIFEPVYQDAADRLHQMRCALDYQRRGAWLLIKIIIGLCVVLPAVTAFLVWSLLAPAPMPVETEPVLEVVPTASVYMWETVTIDGETNSLPFLIDESESIVFREGDSVAPAPVPDGEREYHITHYGPPDFPVTNQVARGGTVQEWLSYAAVHSYDGIVAVSGNTPWYNRVKEIDQPGSPVVIHIEGHGTFVVVDRTAYGNDRNLDIYGLDKVDEPNSATATEVE